MSFSQAMKRPPDYHYLSESEQWSIDKNLGILDWDGNMTPEQEKEYDARFFKPKEETPQA